MNKKGVKKTNVSPRATPVKETAVSSRATPEKKTKPAAAPEVVTIAASTRGRQLVLAALALSALALASGSLLYLVLPADGWRAGV